MQDSRIIAQYIGESKGPLFICFGAMHGNEPVGVKAIELVVKMLEVEPIRSPGFEFRGQFIGVFGNKAAYDQGLRFIDKDLNRHFDATTVEKLQNTDPATWDNEDRELLALDKTVKALIAAYQPDEVILLDIHTTSSFGGIFSIGNGDKAFLRIAKGFYAPIVLGIMEKLRGTTLHYFTTALLGVNTTTISFEAGQHNEPISVNRAVAAIINCMKSIGCVDQDVVENHHEKILIQYGKDLPAVTQLLKRHGITPEDKFKMKPDYYNFQPVKRGEVIANDINGDITIDQNCRILMPLYQTQGEDGFFLVKDII